jgi:hypothetical protein
LNLGIFTIFDKNSGVLEFFPQEPWSFQDPGVVCEMPPRSWSLPLDLGVLTQKPKKKSRRHDDSSSFFFRCEVAKCAEGAAEQRKDTLNHITPPLKGDIDNKLGGHIVCAFHRRFAGTF